MQCRARCQSPDFPYASPYILAQYGIAAHFLGISCQCQRQQLVASAASYVVVPASQLLSWLYGPLNAWVPSEQVVQLFDSWAHTLTPEEFSTFSLPYAQKVIDGVREKRPNAPIMFHANGGKRSCPSINAASPAAAHVHRLQYPGFLSLALHSCRSRLCRLRIQVHAGDSTAHQSPIANHQIEKSYTRATNSTPASHYKSTYRHIRRRPTTEPALQEQSI